ncbi:TlpA family protein disulfide reductase [Sandaracinus amylolyticus]|uniref:TlpA family protein disulfide reductase n=1 Tax=Sandaracinus amylolyticus TaxID=927083 RepID=UPI001F18E60B|nr:hypothetical protein [Sandaracinus amylolyticus]
MLTRSLVSGLLSGVMVIAAASLPPLASRAQDTPASTAATPGPVVDATLDSMRGGRRSLSAERGRRVVVLFYEDRPHVELNDAFKGELLRFVSDNHLGERVVPYGVANLGDVGAVPQTLVRSMIQPLVDRWGIDILLDWEGVMRRAPFSFRTNAANTAIVDREGRIVYRHAGRMEETQRREFYRALRGALR